MNSPGTTGRPGTGRASLSWAAVLALLVSILGLPLAPPAGSIVSDVLSPLGGRPFAVTSAWNVPVPPLPAVDGNSEAIVSWLASAPHPGIADLYEYGVPVWHADASTPTYQVDCVRPWGSCELEQQRVPIPAEAVPSSGSDAAMVVIDWSSRRAFEFWEAQRVDGDWQAGWGGVVDVDGAGAPGRAVGAGVSRLAGVVRTYEMAQGRIDHALVFSTDNACRDVHRYPATKTDGHSSRPDCIPEGARIQLDPTIDLDAIPGITEGEKVVARALQTYGAYAIDNGGAKMAFIFEIPSGEADPYPATGFSWDYFAMDRIPWPSLRVLHESGASLVGIGRLAGGSRYATAAAISAQGWPDGSDDVYLASGREFADALATGALSGRRTGPLLLTEPCALPPETERELARLHPTRLTVVGGEDAVCEAVAGRAATAAGAGLVRLAGADRYATSVALSRGGWPSGADTVHIATGTGFADGLSGGVLAARAGAPVLLAPTCSLPEVVRAELDRLRPARVVVLGGPAALCDDVVADLLVATGAGVSRLAGEDRYATAVATAAEGWPATTPVVYVASGTGFADALSAGPLAALGGAPLLLVPPCDVPGSVAAALDRLQPSKVVVIGGPAAICDGALAHLAPG